MNELHQWQKEALPIFLEKKKLLVEVATGAGKTFFAIKAIIKILKDMDIEINGIYIVETIYLLI